jgi:serine/threonine-protein kinase
MLTGQAPLLETRDPLQRLSKQRFLDVVAIQEVAPALPHWVTMVVNKAMALDPERRYQSPSAMLADLHLAARQMAGKEAAAPAAAAPADDSGIGRGAPPGPQRAVMIVESNQRMQDIYREGLKRAGYRVLLTADAGRAVSRFQQDATAADCVLFAAGEVGTPALESFNQLGEDRRTKAIPALLLLDENQRDWAKKARVADHRKVLVLPLTMKQLRAALAGLIGGMKSN